MQSSKLIKPFIITVIFFFLTSPLFILLPPVFALGDIVINEFSSSTTDDWVELYNNSTQSAQLSGFRIRDSTTNKKDLTGELTPGSFIVVDFSNRLNNDGDVVKLIKLEGESETLAEEIPYGTAGGLCTPGSDGSIGKLPDSSSRIVRFIIHTKGLSNNSGAENPCSTSSPIPTNTAVPTSRPTSKPVSSPTPKIQSTPTIKVLPTSTKTPTQIITSKQAVTKESESFEEVQEGIVLGESVDQKKATEEGNKHLPMTNKTLLLLVVLFIIGGLGFIIGAVILSTKQINKQQKMN